MQVKCFECKAMIEGADTDAAVDSFVAHGQAAHTWRHPEESIRNYARNYAEATLRLKGGAERLAAVAEVAIHPMTAGRVDDFLQFFDHDAFADNPEWASCYCLEPHDPAPADNPERPWRTTRSMMAERLRAGRAFGYLAYIDGRAAGWVNASRRADYRLVSPSTGTGPAPGQVIGVSCFVIAPPYRRHGVAAALLDRVIADAADRGADWIEGYPHNAPAAGDDGSHFRGARSMYDARGFSPVQVRERDTVVVRRPAGL